MYRYVDMYCRCYVHTPVYRYVDISIRLYICVYIGIWIREINRLTVTYRCRYTCIYDIDVDIDTSRVTEPRTKPPQAQHEDETKLN